MDVFGPDDLARFSGEDGGKVLVAAEGKVYDLTSSEKWRRGRHMNRHQAGRDLTTELKAAPHGPEVLERFPALGVVREARTETSAGMRGFAERWLERHPFWRRHPHPAAAHGPVGIVVPVLLFEVLGLALESPATEWAAFLCLIVVFLSLPVAMVTGYVTWWLNYECARKPTIVWKQRLAWGALIFSGGAVCVRLTITDPMNVSDPAILVYGTAIGALTAIIVIIGYLGGTLTFPYK